MAGLHTRFNEFGLIATVALHAALGWALLRHDAARHTAVSAPVTVSLIDSAGERHVAAPPRPQPKPATAPVPAPPVGLGPAAPAERAMKEAPASSITLPRFDADYLDNPPPVYPLLARRLGEQGQVLLRVLVRADGTPAEVTVQHSSGSVRLDETALTAVRRWRFVPARRGNAPVAAPVLVPISFSLRG